MSHAVSANVSRLLVFVFQLELAQSGKFNSQIHVEFTWETQSQEFYDSEDDLDERVSHSPHRLSLSLFVEKQKTACKVHK